MAPMPSRQIAPALPAARTRTQPHRGHPRITTRGGRAGAGGSHPVRAMPAGADNGRMRREGGGQLRVHARSFTRARDCAGFARTKNKPRLSGVCARLGGRILVGLDLCAAGLQIVQFALCCLNARLVRQRGGRHLFRDAFLPGGTGKVVCGAALLVPQALLGGFSLFLQGSQRAGLSVDLVVENPPSRGRVCCLRFRSSARMVATILYTCCRHTPSRSASASKSIRPASR